MRRWGLIGLLVIVALTTMWLTRSGILVSTSTQLEIVREGDLILPYDGKLQRGDSPAFRTAACTYWIGLSLYTVPLVTLPMSDTKASDCPRFMVGK